MLEVISDVVKNITVIVLLAMFVEMLIPNNELARYVQLIMGLFVMITILSPIMALVEKKDILIKPPLDFSENVKKDTENSSVVNQGQELLKLNEKEIANEYKVRIKKQIEALAKLVPGVEDVDSEVTLNDTEHLQYNSISKLKLNVILTEKNAAEKIEIDPIEIDDLDKAGKENSSKKIAQKIRQTIASFYDLEEEKIEIVWQ